MANAIIGPSARRCRNPRSTARTSTRSGTKAFSGSQREAVVCIASAISVSTANNATKRTNLLALRLRRRRLGNLLGHYQYLFEAAKVGCWRNVDGQEQSRPLTRHGCNIAHQEPARENPVQARCYYCIPRLHVLRAVDVLHHQPIVDHPCHDAAHARALVEGVE